MIRIEVSSDFDQLWRYNIFASCRGLSAEGESLYVVGREQISNESIQSGVIPFIRPPMGFSPQQMTLTMEAPEAAMIELSVYFVAHTLPENREVVESPPFDATLCVEHETKEIYRAIYKVNQWGGLSQNINLQIL